MKKKKLCLLQVILCRVQIRKQHQNLSFLLERASKCQSQKTQIFPDTTNPNLETNYASYTNQKKINLLKKKVNRNNRETSF